MYDTPDIFIAHPTRSPMTSKSRETRLFTRTSHDALPTYSLEVRGFANVLTRSLRQVAPRQPSHVQIVALPADGERHDVRSYFSSQAI